VLVAGDIKQAFGEATAERPNNLALGAKIAFIQFVFVHFYGGCPPSPLSEMRYTGDIPMPLVIRFTSTMCMKANATRPCKLAPPPKKMYAGLCMQ
jgi:hypothetical protein